MTEAAFQRIVDRAWAKMRADDATAGALWAGREYVEVYLRLIRQMGGGGKRKGRAIDEQEAQRD